MAAIDYFGNVIRVTAAGTVGVDNLYVQSMHIWTVNTTASLVATDVNSGSTAQILTYSTNSNTPNTDWTHLSGYVGKLSFDTVTACTAWIVKR